MEKNRILNIEDIKDINLFCLDDRSELFEKQVLSYYDPNHDKEKILINTVNVLFNCLRVLNEKLTLMKFVITTYDEEKIFVDVFDMLFNKVVVDDLLISLFACALDCFIENHNMNIMVANYNKDGLILHEIKKQKNKRMV